MEKYDIILCGEVMVDPMTQIALLKTATAIDALSAAGVKNAWIEFENGQIIEIGTPKR